MVCALVVTGLTLVGGAPSVAPAVLALSGMAAAGIAASGTGSVLAALPGGFVLVGAWALTWGLVGGALGLSTLGTRGGAVLGIAAFAALTALAARGRASRVVLIGQDGPAAIGGAVLLSFFVWVTTTQPLEIWSRVHGSGTDFLRHLGVIRDVTQAGNLLPGESGYPKAFSAIGSLLVSALDVPTSAPSLWVALAPVTFLMLVLVLVGAMVVAARLVDELVPGRWPGWLAAALAGFAFVQTAWFSTFLAFGNVMNMVVGVCLMAMLCMVVQDRSVGSLAGSGVAAAAVGVTANAWQLLVPVAVAGALPWLVSFLRKRRGHAMDWAAWSLGGLLALSGVLGLRNLDGGGQASMATVSNLFRPDWWWFAASALALGVCVAALRRGRVGWAACAAGMVVAGVGSVVLLLWITGSTWDLMLYYPVKALWTVAIIVIPLGAAGAVAGLVVIWQRTTRAAPWVALVLRAGCVLAVGVVAAGVLGRSVAFPPHLAMIAQGRAGMVNWQLALIEAMDDVEVAAAARDGVIVFGLVPSLEVGGVISGFAGMVDYMGMEALDHVGFESALYAPVKPGLVQRDMTQVCRYLSDHPDSLRLTGPNPAAGAPWVVASGCAESVVEPERWVSLELDSAWLQGSPWDGPLGTYPTLAQVQEADPRR